MSIPTERSSIPQRRKATPHFDVRFTPKSGAVPREAARCKLALAQCLGAWWSSKAKEQRASRSLSPAETPNSKAMNRGYQNRHSRCYGLFRQEWLVGYAASYVAAWTTASAMTVRPHGLHSNECDSGCLARPGIPRERRMDLPQLGQAKILFPCAMLSPTLRGAVYQIRYQGKPRGYRTDGPHDRPRCMAKKVLRSAAAEGIRPSLTGQLSCVARRAAENANA